MNSSISHIFITSIPQEKMWLTQNKEKLLIRSLLFKFNFHIIPRLDVVEYGNYYNSNNDDDYD